MDKYEHEKVYADFIFPSNPPKYPWICKLCGEQGKDNGASSSNEYEFIKKHFNK